MAATTTETHEFLVEGAPSLAVRNFAGNVTLSAGADGQVRVEVTKRARGGFFGSADDADLERIHVDVKQSGNMISVEAEARDRTLLSKQLSIDIDITAPARSHLDMHLNAGNTDISGIGGVINAKVNAGNLETRGVTFDDRSHLTVSAGNLTLEGALAAGGSLDAEVNAGNARLTLPQTTSAYLDARTHAGTVHVTGWPIDVTRRFAQMSASGALGPNASGSLTVRVNAGNIAVLAG
ncbi:MAG TPA: DUF4097 family beta strand repeat-containing protein [Ktedonobacterales bacterium]|nr:DUF4097 family beta strand repeat-containing protein [Ktedonobacterales bacterium]